MKRPRYVDLPEPVTDEDWLARALMQDARFWAKVERADGCWPYRGGKVDKDGYGRFSITGRGERYPGDRPLQRNIGAHRMAWQLWHRRVVPPGLVVMHACDNPICCNPTHLTVGTQAENRQDCVAKGREPRGSLHHSSKMDERTAQLILDAPTSESLRQVAERLGVTKSVVDQVRKRLTWRHVQPSRSPT